RLNLRLSGKLFRDTAPRSKELYAALGDLRSKVRGIEVPPFHISADDTLAANEIAVGINDTPVTWLTLEGDPIAALREKLPAAIEPLIPELLTVDRVAAMIETAAADAPVLVREVVPRIVTLPVLADILRRLAREAVPIDDLAAILEAIALAPRPEGGF